MTREAERHMTIERKHIGLKTNLETIGLSAMLLSVVASFFAERRAADHSANIGSRPSRRNALDFRDLLS